MLGQLRRLRVRGAHHLLIVETLALERLLVEQRLDADAAGLGPEVAAEGVGAREAAAAAPAAAASQLAAADELLLARVQALVPFAVVLAREGFAADGADEGPLVRVRPQVAAEVVGPRELFWAQGALEGGGVFLDAFGVGGGGAGPLWVGEVEDVVAVGDR